MGYWKIIVPEGTTNLVQNPSFELNVTSGWTNYASGAAAGTRSVTTNIQKFGAFALALQKTGGAQADEFGQYASLGTTTSGASYVAHAWVNPDTGTTITLALVKSAGTGAAQTETVSWSTQVAGTLQYIETDPLVANASGDALLLYVYITGTPTATAYVDGIQAEAKAYATTYTDGDQAGCQWNGALHNSTSSRSALSRAGGRVRDLEDDYYFSCTSYSGTGMPDVTNSLQEFPMQPGGLTNNTKQHARAFTLSGMLLGTTTTTLHDRRQALIGLLLPSRYPGNQPVTLRYTGATITKEIRARYEGGLEAIGAGTGKFERTQIRFLADDPYWYEIGESATALDPMDNDTIRYIGARLKSTGQWSALGLTANPDAGGAIFCILPASDGSVYYGGEFHDLDNTGTNIDHIAKYTPSTGVWSLVGAGSALNNEVNDLAEAPNGDIYAVGNFTNAGGVAAADYVAVWDVSAGAWVAIGTPSAGATFGEAFCCCFDKSGNFYVGGQFDNLAGVAACDGVAKWDGATWTALGTPGLSAAGGDVIYAIAADSVGNIYVGGNFSNIGSVAAADNAAYWDGTAWNALPGGVFNSAVYRITITPDDEVYLTGNFTDVGDSNGDYIVMHNGVDFTSLGAGLNDLAYTPAVAPDGTILVGGQFTTAGGTAVSRLARWNGAVWTPMDLVLSGTPLVELAIGRSDPVVPTNYDIWIGASTTGSAFFGGDTTVTNAGNAPAYPRIEIQRAGGTTAWLVSVRNETLGKELWFSYSMLDGEKLTIYTDPADLRVHSSYYGDRTDVKLKGDDWGDFYLAPGANTITLFLFYDAGTPITNIVWRDTYASAD